MGVSPFFEDQALNLFFSNGPAFMMNCGPLRQGGADVTQCHMYASAVIWQNPPIELSGGFPLAAEDAGEPKCFCMFRRGRGVHGKNTAERRLFEMRAATHKNMLLSCCL